MIKILQSLPGADKLAKDLKNLGDSTQSSENVLDMLIEGIFTDEELK